MARVIHTVDTHTFGQPTRIVLSGLPPLTGSTMEEKMRFFEAQYDAIRGLLLREPRGHRGMYGAVLAEPCRSGAHFGLFFLDNRSYMSMCGHGTIGVAVAIASMGLVSAVGGSWQIVLDTPAGLVEVEVSHGETGYSAQFSGVPSFVDSLDRPLEVPGLGSLHLDLAYGGNQFAFVDADQLDVDLEPSRLSQILDLGMRILNAARKQFTIHHPDRGPLPVNIVTISQGLNGEPKRFRNVHVFGDRQYDRSPGGTATCARVALLKARGQLSKGEEILVESLSGGEFRGRELGAEIVAGREMVTSQVQGAAWVTGFHQFVLDPTDPWPSGFLLGD